MLSYLRLCRHQVQRYAYQMPSSVRPSKEKSYELLNYFFLSYFIILLLLIVQFQIIVQKIVASLLPTLKEIHSFLNYGIRKLLKVLHSFFQLFFLSIQKHFICQFTAQHAILDLEP